MSTQVDSQRTHYPVIIVGNGIAGLSAAIYAGRAGNEPLVIAGDQPGGQLTLTMDVANYPGFPEGISGPELVANMESQAKRFGAEIIHGSVSAVHPNKPFEVELANGTTYTSDSVIAASGASARWLDIPGEDKFMGYGVSSCATCDGAFFRGEEMIVVGGGDAACEEAVFLTKFASKVYLVHRRDEFRAEQYWVDKVQDCVDDGSIEILFNAEVVEVLGDENVVSGAKIITHPDGNPTSKLAEDVEQSHLDVGAVFVAIGHTPNTAYLEDTPVKLDDEGYIETSPIGPKETATEVPGLFAAGDVVDKHYQQAITAGAMGCKAALDCDAYLDDMD